MNPNSHILQRVLKLDPPVTRDLVIQRSLRVPMPDGVDLLADRWAPRSGGDTLPVAVLRSPYGRAGLIGNAMVRPLAERGFQVLVQSVRGTFGSGGVFDPFRQEREDGLSTLDWVIEQPWFAGSIVLTGGSYLGYVQWAVADRLPPEVKAMVPQLTESALTLEFLRGDGFSLETPFGWGLQVDGQERRGALLRQVAQTRKNRRALRTLPLALSDVAAAGHQVDYVQSILAHDADSPRWAGVDHRHRVAEVTVPVSMTGGWYDIFLPGQLRDFQVLQDAERAPRLTVGPWTHLGADGSVLNESIAFGLAHAHGERPPERAPVRLYVMGQEAWRDFDSWPPKGYLPQLLHLRTGGGLSAEPAIESEPDRYRYDPADPTPAAGGARMTGGGRVDNGALEARADVLTYTTPAHDQDIEVLGEVSAEIWFSSSLSHADMFVRLCDVDPRGRSTNVCDGLVSLTTANETGCATVRLWPTAYRLPPTAYRFGRGHRIRVQVSSGAFPRYARNPGTGEPHATATVLRAADQTVYHDPARPSAVILPMRVG